MTPLRQRMHDALVLHGKAARTQDAYIEAVARLARYYRRSPDRLNNEQVQQYLLHLLQTRCLSRSTVNQAGCAFRFFYGTAGLAGELAHAAVRLSATRAESHGDAGYPGRGARALRAAVSCHARIEPRAGAGLARYRCVPHGCARRRASAMRRLWPPAVALAFVPQPSLPALPEAGRRRVAPGAHRRTAQRAVCAPGLHAATRDQPAGALAFALGVRDDVGVHGGHAHRVRGQRALARRAGRLHAGAAHVVAGFAAAHPCACAHCVRCVGRRRTLAAAGALGALPVSGARVVQGVRG